MEGLDRMGLHALTHEGFQNQIIGVAKWNGWMVYHTHNSRRSTKGFPDLCMARRGRIVFAELKVGKDRPFPAQKEWFLELSKNAHVRVCLWFPHDWEDLVKVLEE